MRKFTGIVIFAAALGAAAACRAAEGPESPGPMAVRKWLIGWDRLGKMAVVNATFKNTSIGKVSNLTVVLEFFDDRGKIVKRSPPWRKSYLNGRDDARMKLRLRGCPFFQRYRVKLTGSAQEKFEQLFEGNYWPDRPGNTPSLPEPVVFAEGAADVRVVGSREEFLKVSRRREILRISGTVQNLGDRPAENIVVKITLLDGKKAVWTDEIPIKTKRLSPGTTAPFSALVKRLPHHTSVVYHVDSKSIEIEEAAATIEKFDVEAGPLLIRDCSIDLTSGLFTGTLINKGGKTVCAVVVNIDIEKGEATTSYKIQPGGDIKPGDKLSLIKATMPGFDKFMVNVAFREK